ncbi:unnamed protein product [Adineta steineri]|uniref:G-protein coupled receptors family 1 profile domain-containing protein n=1 Tax=Adineta steineri TaxID=433720 RepID=A0A819FI34_9BILA|nr:unnamed protein product [Adineta steineri]CAF3866738.1 unnamed protein product [Adineta steineri]
MSSLIVRFTTQPAVYYLPFVYIIGLIGNILNIIVFYQSKLHSNSCSLYFICLSVAHLLMLNCPCLLRIVAAASNYNVFGRVNILCKLSTYLDVLSLVLSRNFLCLICINRWIITSPNAWLRKQSSLRTARWAVAITLSFWLVFNIHSAIGYNTVNDMVCSSARDYIVFSSIFHIVTAIVSLIIMIVFSILTLINMRQVGRRTNPLIFQTNRNQLERQSKKKRELQFIRLSLVQVLLYVILTSLRTFMPIVVYYVSVVRNASSNEREIMYLFFYWGTYLLYTYAAGFGVFARRFIPRHSYFGPYGGSKHNSRLIKETSDYSWEVRDKSGNIMYYIDGSELNRSNWLRFVNCPNTVSQENLISFMFHGDIFYLAIRNITVGEELLVYYGHNYAKRLGVDTTLFR